MVKHPNNKKILYAVLNWGLGHATRSYQLITELTEHQNEVWIASSGEALNWLKANFPQHQFLEIPDYQIVYPTSPTSSKWAFGRKLLSQQKRIRKAIQTEHDLCEKWMAELEIDMVYSDHCLGFYSRKVPSYIIAHQVQILAPAFKKWANKWHQKQLKNFNKILIPDYPDQRLSGILSNCDFMKHAFIGPLSRMKGIKCKGSNIAVFISGPEPHRTYFEDEVLELIKLGKISHNENEVHIWGAKKKLQKENVHFHEASTWDPNLISSCGTWYSRSGYTSIMDAYVTGAKLIAKATPGQVEQEYLASKSSYYF